VGTRSDPAYSLLQLVHGSRVCYDTSENGVGNAAELCGASRAEGGWCPDAVGIDTGGEWVPNRHVYVFNNVFYNPAGAETANPHLNVQPAVTPPAGSNIPAPSAADDDVRVAGNIIWNGAADHPLGLDEATGCAAANPTCNEAAIRADNAIHAAEPLLVDPENGDLHPVAGGAILAAAAMAIPDFSWSDVPARPTVPPGDPSNAVPLNRDGSSRGSPAHPGAY
jgi:hypothetical protein